MLLHSCTCPAYIHQCLKMSNQSLVLILMQYVNNTDFRCKKKGRKKERKEGRKEGRKKRRCNTEDSSSRRTIRLVPVFILDERQDS